MGQYARHRTKLENKTFMLDKCNKLFRAIYNLRKDFDQRWIKETLSINKTWINDLPGLEDTLKLGCFDAYDAYLKENRFPIPRMSV